MKLKVKSSFVAAASLNVSKDKIRKYLQTVLITPAKDGGVFVVSTDGYVMSVFKDENGFVERDMMLFVSKNLYSASSENYFLVEENDVISIRDEDDNIQYMEAMNTLSDDYTYPDWKRIFGGFQYRWDNDKNGAPQTFNVNLVSKFEKIFKKAYGKKRINLISIIYGEDSTSPSLIKTDEKDFMGLIMPISSKSAIDSNISFTLD